MNLTLKQKRAAVYFTGCLWLLSPLMAYALLAFAYFAKPQELEGAETNVTTQLKLQGLPLFIYLAIPNLLFMDTELLFFEQALSVMTAIPLIVAVFGGYFVYSELKQEKASVS